MKREITKRKKDQTHERPASIPYKREPLRLLSISPPVLITNQQRSGSRQTLFAARQEKGNHHLLSARTEARHGEVAVLREGAHQQGRVDQGGGPAPRRLHQGARRRVLALAAQGRRPPTLRQELPPPLDELPPPGPQARQLHRRRRRAHHQAPRPAREQVVVDRGAAARPDRQRDQELLEHAHQAQAPQPRGRPADAPPAQRRRRRQRARGQRAHELQHRRLLVHRAGAQARAPGHHRPGQCNVRRGREVRTIGGRPEQQRRKHGRAAVPRSQPGPRPVRGPAVLAAQDAGHNRIDAHVAAAADANLPVLSSRRPGQRGLQLQDRLAVVGVPVSQATRGGAIHIGVVWHRRKPVKRTARREFLMEMTDVDDKCSLDSKSINFFLPFSF